MSDGETNSWGEYRLLVERYMKESSEDMKAIADRLSKIENKLSLMEGKAGLLGTLGGLIGGALLSYLFAHFK